MIKLNYNKETEEYLKSFHRKVANRIIKYELDNNLFQEQLSKLLDIDFATLVKVEFNFPRIEEDIYKKVWEGLDKIDK